MTTLQEHQITSVQVHIEPLKILILTELHVNLYNKLPVAMRNLEPKKFKSKLTMLLKKFVF